MTLPRQFSNVRLCLGAPADQSALTPAPYSTWVLPSGLLWAEFFRHNDRYTLRFPGFADFELSLDATEVRCSPVPGTNEDSISHLYFNQVLPLALSKQGELVFHASAVVIEQHAVAFVGESGRGKSTLAASFASHGFPFLTDDALLIQPAKDQAPPLASPSRPSIRLWGDSSDAVLPTTIPKAPPLTISPKGRFLYGDSAAYCDTAQPLRKVYFLGPGEAANVSITPMRPVDSLIGWVSNSFVLDRQDSSIVGRHFDRVSLLANQVEAYHLDFPRRFDELVAVRAAVAQHAGA